MATRQRTAAQAVDAERNTAEAQKRDFEALFAQFRTGNDRDVAKKFFEKYSIVPQGVGYDGPGTIATVDSPTFWNLTDVTQVITPYGNPGEKITVMPGDFVVGMEFRRFSDKFGGALKEYEGGERGIRAALKMPVAVASRRDCAYFQLRGSGKGNISERVRGFELADSPFSLEDLPRPR